MYSKKKLIISAIASLFIGMFIVLASLSYVVSSLTGTTTGTLKIIAALNIMKNKYVQESDPHTFVNGAIKGIANSVGDPHTAYIHGEAYKRLVSETKGEFGGIGSVIGEKDGYPTIVAPIEDSPSTAAGVKAGDKILKVDDVDTKGWTLEDTVSKIRGPKGTSVKLLLRSEDGTEREVNIVRDIIKSQTVAGKMLEGDIGYIRLAHFSENSPEELGKALKDLDAKGMKKLILDLRHNPGGSLNASVGIANYIIPKGPVVSIVHKTGKKDEYFSQLEKPKYELVVLIDKGSASASEIIAGAVQDTKAGTLVGQTTYGKGSVQTVIPLDFDSAFKVTIAKYYTPSNRTIDGVGVKPDVEVELQKPVDGKLVDNQLNKAIEVLRDK